MKKVITRHPALVGLLLEWEVIKEGEYVVISHATKDDIQGQDVIGVLPLSLASLAASVTEVPLALTLEDRGKELSLDRLRQIAKAPRTYIVRGPAFTDNVILCTIEGSRAGLHNRALKRYIHFMLSLPVHSIEQDLAYEWAKRFVAGREYS